MRYSRLFGCADLELRRLINFDSCWLLACKGVFLPSVPELVLSDQVLSHKIDEYTKKVIGEGRPGGCDTTIAMSKDGLWHNIRFSNPLLRTLDHEISFVRCEPSAVGMQWVKPTWRDEISIDSIQERMSRMANFVIGFDGKAYGPSDLVNLRFAIYRLPTYKEFNESNDSIKPKFLSLTSGILEEYQDRFLDSFKQQGLGHYIVTEWLCSGLMEVLRPHMHGFPYKYWKITSGYFSGVLVELDVPYRELVKSGQEDLLGYKLQIELVEDLQGSLNPVCWSTESRASTVKRMQELLADAVNQEALSDSADSMR